MKDGAGQLRSFDYALHATLLRLAVDGADIQLLRQQLGAEWLRQTQLAFVAGYDGAAQAAGITGAAAQRDGLLELFLLEKAMYELNYELDNRPDWVRIPLRGLIDLLEARA